MRKLTHIAAGILLVLGLLRADRATAQSDGATLQSRIDDASPGDTLVVREGEYDGPIVVDRPLTLVGTGRPHILGDGQTHTVRITAADVTMTGFEISRSGGKLNVDHAGVMITAPRATLKDNRLHDILHGIYVKGADQVVLEANRITGRTRLKRPQRGNGIHLWKSTGNRLRRNEIWNTRDGIYFSFTDETEAIENRVHDVRYGLHFMYSDGNRFANNVFYDNASGSALMYSEDLHAEGNVFRDNRTKNGYGLLLQSLERSTFTGNRLVSNMTGLYLENSTANTFRGNLVRANFRGLRLSGSSMRNLFSGNAIHGNITTASLSGVSTSNMWSENGRGNYWGSSRLLDLDADGISEMPRYIVDVLGGEGEGGRLRGLLASSPGIELLSFALRRAPPPGLPKIVDPHPLVRSPVTSSSFENGRSSDSGGRWGAALASMAGILGFSLFIRRKTK